MTAAVPAGGSTIRDRALALLAAHAAAEGLGPDPYHAEPCVHPMAEAKYLMAMTVMRSLGAGSNRAVTDPAVADAIGRLERGASRDPDGATSWGLGFEYKGAPASTSYVVTTAMVLRALAELVPVCPAGLLTRVDGLLESTYRWLADPERLTAVDGVRVPSYGPTVPLVAYNVVAYWAGAMAVAAARLGTSHVEGPTAAAWVESERLPDLGWTYSRDSTRVDLLHICYVATGLRAALPARAAALGRHDERRPAAADR